MNSTDLSKLSGINNGVTYIGEAHEIEHETRRRQTRSRLYVEIAGENVLENLMNRRSRPHAEYKKLLKPLLDQLGVKAYWSQKAGCSCGCSPGFILNQLVTDERGACYNIYITLKKAT